MAHAPGTLHDIAAACLHGSLSRAEISELARDYWDRDDFVHYVEAEQLSLVRPSGPATRRYAGAPNVLHWKLYGDSGSPGCVLVESPHDAQYEDDFGALQVPPHVHDTDHIAIVLEGSGSFVVARPHEDGARVMIAPARPGLIAFYPRGVPHTFVSGPDGIVVASVQSEFEAPESPGFATLVRGGLAGMERVPIGA
jgi:hypothetical protein